MYCGHFYVFSYLYKKRCDLRLTFNKAFPRSMFYTILVSVIKWSVAQTSGVAWLQAGMVWFLSVKVKLKTRIIFVQCLSNKQGNIEECSYSVFFPSSPTVPTDRCEQQCPGGWKPGRSSLRQCPSIQLQIQRRNPFRVTRTVL